MAARQKIIEEEKPQTIRLVPPMLSEGAKTVPMPLENDIMAGLKSRPDGKAFLDLIKTGGDAYRYQSELTVKGPPFSGFELSIYSFPKEGARIRLSDSKRPEAEPQTVAITPGAYTIESPLFVDYLPGGREKQTKYVLSFNVTKDSRVEVQDGSGNIVRALDMDKPYDREQIMAILTAYALAPQEDKLTEKRKNLLLGCFSLISQQGQVYEIKSGEERSEKRFNDIVNAKGIAIVKFGTDWCGPCKKLGVVLDQMAGQQPHLRFVSLDITEAYKNIEEEGKGGWAGSLFLSLYNRLPGATEEAPPVPLTVIFKDGKAVAALPGVPRQNQILETIEKPPESARLK